MNYRFSNSTYCTNFVWATNKILLTNSTANSDAGTGFVYRIMCRLLHIIYIVFGITRAGPLLV